MIHHYTNKEDESNSDHVAVNYTGDGFVLLQLQSGSDQVRLKVTPEMAKFFAEEINRYSDIAVQKGSEYQVALSDYTSDMEAMNQRLKIK